MFRFTTTTLVVLHLLLPAATVLAADKPGETKPERKYITWHEVLRRYGASSKEKVETAASLCEKAPVYQRLGIADQIIKGLPHPDASPIPGYVRQEGHQDLSCTPGRAAFVLERILGQKLQPVHAESTEVELRAAYRDAKRLLEAYRSGVMAVATDYNVGPSPDDLARKYRGEIVPNSLEHADASIQAMLSLFEEWLPVGRETDELEKIIGVKGGHSEKRVAFYFGGRWHGTTFILNVDGRTITSILITAH